MIFGIQVNEQEPIYYEGKTFEQVNRALENFRRNKEFHNPGWTRDNRVKVVNKQ